MEEEGGTVLPQVPTSNQVSPSYRGQWGADPVTNLYPPSDGTHLEDLVAEEGRVPREGEVAVTQVSLSVLKLKFCSILICMLST